MPVKFEGSVMQVGNSLRITIPKEIAKHLNLDRSDTVELWVDNHSMVMEKKVFVYDAIWAFQEDVMAIRNKLSKNIKAHTSQPLGRPLHRFKGQLRIDGDKIMLKGKDANSSEAKTLFISLEDVEDVHLGWDNTIRRRKDTRAIIRPLRIIFKFEEESKTIYIYAKKPEAQIYGKENENISQMILK